MASDNEWSTAEHCSGAERDDQGDAPPVHVALPAVRCVCSAQRHTTTTSDGMRWEWDRAWGATDLTSARTTPLCTPIQPTGVPLPPSTARRPPFMKAFALLLLALLASHAVAVHAGQRAHARTPPLRHCDAGGCLAVRQSLSARARLQMLTASLF